MTLTFTDGCDSYASSSDLTKKWATASGATWSASAGRNGGGAIQFINTSGNVTSFPIFNAQINFGLWVRFSAKPSSGFFMPFMNSGGSQNAGLAVDATTGFLSVYNQNPTLVASGTINLGDNNWHFIDCQMYVGGNGTQVCYVDGAQQWSFFGNFSSTLGAAVKFALGGNSAIVTTYDDAIVYDNNGFAPVNASHPLGTCQITTRRPNGDNAVQFAPDTGSTNYTQINEVNGDMTHYVQDGTSGHQDLYNYEDLTFSPSKIIGVMANAYLLNPGVTSLNHNQLCKNGSTTTTGAAVSTPLAAGLVQQPFVLDPNTGSAWASSTAVNSALFGIKVS